MTIVIRAESPPSLIDLGAVGVCRVTVGRVLGTFGTGAGPWRVEYLGPIPIHQPEGREDGSDGSEQAAAGGRADGSLGR